MGPSYPLNWDETLVGTPASSHWSCPGCKGSSLELGGRLQVPAMGTEASVATSLSLFLSL